MLELTRVSAHASFLSTISTPPSALYILSLHDALPISRPSSSGNWRRNLPENNQSSASAGGGRFQPGERVTSLGAAPDTPHIEFTDVIKRFGDNTVLNDLNFTVAQGERVRSEERRVGTDGERA